MYLPYYEFTFRNSYFQLFLAGYISLIMIYPAKIHKIAFIENKKSMFKIFINIIIMRKTSNHNNNLLL